MPPAGTSSGGCPDAPTNECQGRCPEPHQPFEKGWSENFSTEKFLRCEQSAVNTEYSEIARPAIRKVRLNLFASNQRKVSGSAEAFSIKYAFAKQKRTY